jgi:hypothetical protein
VTCYFKLFPFALQGTISFIKWLRSCSFLFEVLHTSLWLLITRPQIPPTQFHGNGIKTFKFSNKRTSQHPSLRASLLSSLSSSSAATATQLKSIPTIFFSACFTVLKMCLFSQQQPNYPPRDTAPGAPPYPPGGFPGGPPPPRPPPTHYAQPPASPWGPPPPGGQAAPPYWQQQQQQQYYPASVQPSAPVMGTPVVQQSAAPESAPAQPQPGGRVCILSGCHALGKGAAIRLGCHVFLGPASCHFHGCYVPLGTRRCFLSVVGMLF